MKFSRLFLNRLQNPPKGRDTVVVIDVLRSFTTAAIALDRGATAIYPVDGVLAANQLANRLDNPVTIGAVGGGDPIPGFDFGNSPSQVANADLLGRTVVMSTAAGIRGLQRFSQARRLFAASLANAKATADAIATCQPEEVCFIVTGEWVDRDGDEDIACADYLQALLSGQNPDVEPFIERVRNSDFGRRFTADNSPNLPLADLKLCAQANCFNFAMQVVQENGRLVIRTDT
jgi:2-phosphosulfolactate phosphatase